MKNIVLFGPPGAGKGTQAEKIVAQYHFVHLSTGDILRGEISQKSKLGMEAKSFMDKGELVPDQLVISMIDGVILRNKGVSGFIFDGFPRTTAQAAALDQLLTKNNTTIHGMIALEVEKQELINRLLKRAEKSGREDDKDLSIIENRIKVYNNETAPVIDFYRKQSKYYPVNGIGSIETIYSDITAIIDKL